jgi:hypothetical protein
MPATGVRVSQGTPKNVWSPVHHRNNGPVAQYAGAVVTDAGLCALTNVNNSPDADFGSGSSTPPRWVADLPGGNYVTHRVAIGLTAPATPAATNGVIVKFAAVRNDERVPMAPSPEVFAEIECLLGTNAIPLTAAERAKFLPPGAPAGLDWFWATTYNLVRNAAYGGVGLAASIPPSFRYDFNGNAHVIAAPTCVTVASSPTRASQACIVVMSGQ